LNAREQIWFAFVLPEMLGVDLFEEIKLRALISARDVFWPGQVENRRA
jgi:hypothetical protein